MHLNGTWETHRRAQLLGLEDDGGRKLVGFIDCEPHQTAEFERISAAVSSDSQILKVALLREAKFREGPEMRISMTRLELMVYNVNR